MAATVFTIANQKGGVGKTTTAINLSAALAQEGIPTLIIDLDPQANATSGLGLPKEPGSSLYGALHGEENAIDKIIPTAVENLSIIPSEVDLAAIEIELGQKADYLLQLRGVLAPVIEDERFKAIILDCPPALGLISMNALAAADYLLIALQCEYLAMEGLGQILGVMQQIRDSGINGKLDLGGIIMTMYDVRTNLCREVVYDVRDTFGEQVFKSVIPRTIRLGEAPSHGLSIFEYDKLSPGAVAYGDLGAEIAKKFRLK